MIEAMIASVLDVVFVGSACEFESDCEHDCDTGQKFCASAAFFIRALLRRLFSYVHVVMHASDNLNTNLESEPGDKVAAA